MRRSFAIALILLAVPAAAQTIRDKNGNPIGHYSQEGSRTYFRDNAGNPHGYWQQEGNSTAHRTNDGNLIDKVGR